MDNKNALTINRKGISEQKENSYSKGFCLKRFFLCLGATGASFRFIAAFLEDDQGAVFTDIRARERIAGTRYGCGPCLCYAFHQAINRGPDVSAGNEDVQLAALGFACVVAAGAGRAHVHALFKVGEH